ncbi:hypothetical protein BS47DRAFT_234458 [Hydnum rufescens UP504]|uniref:Uncharacterized protein n=1 Tax=Hydnum rufescens UP504 TaxID=1448309 RepID=A0A9P6AM20_9AGAM|nr:hypothetical protein BS47DRAFT_234458 [Hydnum rufescens UP504]
MNIKSLSKYFTGNTRRPWSHTPQNANSLHQSPLGNTLQALKSQQAQVSLMYLGASIIANRQSCFDDTRGTVWACRVEDPGNQIQDKKAGASKKPLEQVLAIAYSNWPDQPLPAGIIIRTHYDASTDEHELDVLKTAQLAANGRALPPGITCRLSVTRKLRSDFKTRVIFGKIVAVKDIIVSDAKALGKLIRHPSRIPQYFVAPRNPSNTGPASM